MFTNKEANMKIIKLSDKGEKDWIIFLAEILVTRESWKEGGIYADSIDKKVGKLLSIEDVSISWKLLEGIKFTSGDNLLLILLHGKGLNDENYRDLIERIKTIALKL